LGLLQAVIDASTLLSLQKQVQTVHISEPLLDYLQAVLKMSRISAHFKHGLSPRAGLAIKQAAQSWAFLHERDYATPEDIQAILPSVVNHRLQLSAQHGETTKASDLLLEVAIR
jgi:MoxR-like ATPase